MQHLLLLIFQTFALAIMLMARCGNKDRESHLFLGWADPHVDLLTSGNPAKLSGDWLDANAFGDVVGYGFVFILSVQILAIIFGDRAPIHVSLVNLPI
jgi:hypothetical protein